MFIFVSVQLRVRLAQHVKGETARDDSDRFLHQCIWWKPEETGSWYRGVIVSKDFGHGGEILYHVEYDDGDEADLEPCDMEDSNEYTFTCPDDSDSSDSNDVVDE